MMIVWWLGIAVLALAVGIGIGVIIAGPDPWTPKRWEDEWGDKN